MQERDAVFTSMCSPASTQPFGESCIGQISQYRTQTHLKILCRLSGSFSFSSHEVQKSCMEAGSCRSGVYRDLSFLLGWEVQDSWDYSVTPWSISNTHKPCGAWQGKWAKATCQTLGQAPRGPSELAKDQQQVCVAGILWEVVPSSHPLSLVAYTTCPTSQCSSSASHLAEQGWFAAPQLPSRAWH